MAGIRTNDPDHPLASDDLAITTDTFDRSHNFHFNSPEMLPKLFGTKHNATLGKVIRRQLHGDLITGKYANIVHAHFPGNMAQ